MIHGVRAYVPLIGFVVPTAVMGYGIVLPRNGVCGVNELTVGFATTILGAALTYVAGIRLARQTSCSKPPLGRRIAQYINRQASAPHGVFGRLLGLIWRFESAKINQRTLELLEIEPQHDVLEIGCGPGVALREASRRAHAGNVVGLDVSETMVGIASRRNRAAIAAGRASVRRVDGTELELEPAAFDRIFSVHSLYFWKQPEQMLVQLRQALRPGGRLILTFRPDSPDLPERFRDPTYRFYPVDDVIRMLERSGFTKMRRIEDAAEPTVCFVAAA